jgi:hypothetical protein
MAIISHRLGHALARRSSTGRLRARQRHRLGRRAFALVDPPLRVKPCLRLERSVFVEIAEAIDERLARPCPTAPGGTVVGRDRSKADEFCEIAGALERESAPRAQLVEKIGGVVGVVEAGLACHALEMRHQYPFRSVSSGTIHDLRI